MSLIDLPDEILYMIQRKLGNYHSFARFNCVCKRFYKLPISEEDMKELETLLETSIIYISYSHTFTDERDRIISLIPSWVKYEIMIDFSKYSDTKQWGVPKKSYHPSFMNTYRFDIIW